MITSLRHNGKWEDSTTWRSGCVPHERGFVTIEPDVAIIGFSNVILNTLIIRNRANLIIHAGLEVDHLEMDEDSKLTVSNLTVKKMLNGEPTSRIDIWGNCDFSEIPFDELKSSFEKKIAYTIPKPAKFIIT